MKIKTIGIVGVGNMGSAILRGILKKKLFRPSRILAYDVISAKASSLAKELKIHSAKSAAEIAAKSDLILLAVKPQNLPETAAALKSQFKKNPAIITILAGVPVKTIKKHFGSKAIVVRAMPNLGATVGESFTAITGDKALLPVAGKIFSSCGEVMVFPESRFHAVTALSGSGPAYYFFLMELAMIEALKRGFSAGEAARLAKQTAKGAAILAAGSQLDPAVLRAQVTSKGGTTEAALGVLFDNKFPALFSKAIDAAVKRGEQLGKAVS